jgi:hypothetical protein
MELTTPGGLEAYFAQLTEARNVGEIVKVFKDLLLKAYGEKTPDGKRFVKTVNGVPLAEAFSQTEAYSTLFVKLATNAEEGVAFIQGITPKVPVTQAGIEAKS